MYTVNLLSNDLLFGIYIDLDLTRPCQYYSICIKSLTLAILCIF